MNYSTIGRQLSDWRNDECGLDCYPEGEGHRGVLPLGAMLGNE